MNKWPRRDFNLRKNYARSAHWNSFFSMLMKCSFNSMKLQAFGYKGVAFYFFYECYNLPVYLSGLKGNLLINEHIDHWKACTNFFKGQTSLTTGSKTHALWVVALGTEKLPMIFSSNFKRTYLSIGRYNHKKMFPLVCFLWFINVM